MSLRITATDMCTPVTWGKSCRQMGIWGPSSLAMVAK